MVRKTNPVQDAFEPEDIYYRLLMQGAHATDISIKVRKGTKLMPKLDESDELRVGGVPMLSPTYAKRDYELTMTANYARSMRLLDPDEYSTGDNGSAIDFQSLHSEVRFGFAVFENEKSKETAGSRYKFKFGEGSCDVDPKIKEDPAALLNERRANLYRYQTWEPPPDATPNHVVKDEMHTIEVGSLELFKQPRAIGYPMFVSPFVEKSSTRGLVYDGDGTVDLTDVDNRKKYHRAMRYRFEVMRLWWKLFHNQYDAVQKEIFIQSMGGEESKINGYGILNEAFKTITDSTRPSMILSVIELGKEGSLRYGNIYPRYKESDQFDEKKNRNFFQKLDPAPDDVMYSRVENEHEQMDTEPVQLFESYCWPVVMPGMSNAWLEWVAASRTVKVDGEKKVVDDVKYKNSQVYQTMQALFTSHLGVAVDYDTIVQTPPPVLQTYIDRLFQSSERDPERKRKSFWTLVEVISTDLLNAMPYWANSYLCEDLVSHPAEETEEATREKQELEAELESLDLDIEVKERGLKIPVETATDKAEMAARMESRKIQEGKLYNMIHLRAKKRNRLYELTRHSSASSVLWMPYASRVYAARRKNDDDALYSRTWAQECLHRCILSIYDGAWHELYSTNTGPMGQVQRSYDGTQIPEGHSVAAELYRQWFAEAYKGLGKKGLALPKQLVIMTNLVGKGGEPVLGDRPGTVQLQGHVARILGRKQKAAGKSESDLPLFEYVLETWFDFVGTKEEFDEAKAGRKVSPSNKWLVTLSGKHIMPFSYMNQYRYGDIVEVKDVGKIAAEMTPENIERNNLIYRGANASKPFHWSVADSVCFGPSPDIGSLVLATFDREKPAGDKDYLRYPIMTQPDASGVERKILNPLDKAVPVVLDLDTYRLNQKDILVPRRLRPNKLHLVVESLHADDIDTETEVHGGDHAKCEHV